MTSAARSRNVRRLYAIAFFGNLNFQAGVWILFLQSEGLTLLHVGILQALLNAAMLLAELPSGALADRIGRRRVLLLARLLNLVYLLLLAAGLPFGGLVVAFVAYGLSYAFISGAEIAILVESGARGDAAEESSARVVGRYFSIMTLATALALAAGGLVQSISWPAVFLVTAAGQLAALVLTASLVETAQARTHTPLLRQMRETVAFARRSPLIRPLVIALGLFTGIGSYVYLFTQSLLADGGLAITAISGAYALEAAAAAAAAAVAYRIQRRLGGARVVLLGCAISALLFAAVGSGLTALVLAGFVLHGVVDNVVDSVGQALVADAVPEARRATALSLVGLAATAVMVLAGPVVGGLSQALDLSAAVILVGTTSMAVAVALLARAQAAPIADGRPLPEPVAALDPYALPTDRSQNR